MSRCPNCGIETDSRFCPNCGTPIPVTGAPQPQVPPVGAQYDSAPPMGPDGASHPQIPPVGARFDGVPPMGPDGASHPQVPPVGARFDSVPPMGAAGMPQNEIPAMGAQYDSFPPMGAAAGGAGIPGGHGTAGGAGIPGGPGGPGMPGGPGAVPGAPAPKKPISKGLIAGIAAAAVVLIAVVFLLTRPKLDHITASYSGDVAPGTSVNSSSNFVVTAYYENDTSKEVTGWSVSDTVLEPGNNTVTVSFKDKSCNVAITSPIMINGKFVATVSQINKVLDEYCRDNLKGGYTGLSEKDEKATTYTMQGITKPTLNVSYTTMENGKAVDTAEDAIPDNMIITGILGTDEISDYGNDLMIGGGGGLVCCGLLKDSTEAFDTIKEQTLAALRNATGSVGTATTTIGGVPFTTGVLVVNGRGLFMYSIKTNG